MEFIIINKLSITLLIILIIRTSCLMYKSHNETVQMTNKFLEQGIVKTREEVVSLIDSFEEPTTLTYHSNKEIYEIFKQLHNQYPNLTKLDIIGKSVKGQELFVIVISKYPTSHQPGIPEIKYIANMHGNEVTGRELLLEFAKVLLLNYGKNRYITRLVDTTRIHIMPTMNPDGYDNSQMGVFNINDDGFINGRENANNVDLNRNFPSRNSNYRNYRIQPETQAIIDWTLKNPFVMSANFHGGTRVVNYPFDDDENPYTDHGVFSKTNDHEIFVKLAYTYARSHNNMWKEGGRCEDPSFNDPSDTSLGIVNGAEWYEVHGGMQDWNYNFANCFEVTVEVNCIKFPPQEHLIGIWNDNKYSLFSYLSQVHNTIHGFVFDEVTGKAIEGATIGINDMTKIIQTYIYGDYWRLVNPGTYQVTFDHPLYNTVVKQVTITPEDPQMYLNVTMRPIKDDNIKMKDDISGDNNLSDKLVTKTRVDVNNGGIEIQKFSIKIHLISFLVLSYILSK